VSRIRVAVTGALGKMGREVLAAVSKEADLELVGGIDRVDPAQPVTLPGGGSVVVSADLAALIEEARPQVVVDFSHATATPIFAQQALPRGVAMVVGTTGLSSADLEEMRRLSEEHGVGAIVAPNFALGAVLMMHVCRILAPFFDYAEIIEMHHEAKVDAPSGTALATATAMLESRGRPFQYTGAKKETLAGTRGGVLEGVAIHSVRAPGLVAHQEVIFGALGQTLTVRHDSVSRESFMPGVLLAVREVVKRKEFVYGLDKLLGIDSQ